MCSACGKYIDPLSREMLQDITAQGEKLQAICDGIELSFHLSCDALLQHYTISITLTNTYCTCAMKQRLLHAV